MSIVISQDLVSRQIILDVNGARLLLTPASAATIHKFLGHALERDAEIPKTLPNFSDKFRSNSYAANVAQSLEAQP